MYESRCIRYDLDIAREYGHGAAIMLGLMDRDAASGGVGVAAYDEETRRGAMALAGVGIASQVDGGLYSLNRSRLACVFPESPIGERRRGHRPITKPKTWPLYYGEYLSGGATAREVSAALGVGLTTFYKWVKETTDAERPDKHGHGGLR